MISLVLLVCSLAALVSSDPRLVYDIEDAELMFEEFIQKYEKNYSSEQEKKIRFEIFKENLIEVNEANQREDNAELGVTKFSDLTLEEFRALYTGLQMPTGGSPCQRRAGGSSLLNDTMAPEQFDWRKQNVVTSVKDQGKCGSCWTFSTIGNVEGQYAIVHKQLQDFSEQQLLDCDHSNSGCGGGRMGKALLYLIQAGGAMAFADYPYTPMQTQCRFDRNKVRVRVTGCTQYTFSSEDELKETLASTGPIAIGINANSLKRYNGGILKQCEGGPFDHAVLLVGYGTENGVPYWIIKNSYGPNWGEQGYLRIQRNVNACGIIYNGGYAVSSTVA